MSEILSRITAHFDALGTREIAVPEWDAVFYVTPVTVAERQRIYGGSRSGDNDFELLVRILIEKARDKDGKKVFTIADKPTLLQRADSAVLVRVAGEILSGGEPPRSDELKN